jgi:LacI family transcriptional regulator
MGLVLAAVGNPFYAEVAAGIDAARMLGYEVFLAHTQESGDVLSSIVNAMIARRVDGILLTVLYPDDGEVVRRLRGAGVAFVQLSRRIPDLLADFVGVDDRAAAQDIMRHVVDVDGHTDVAVITGPRNSSASATRAESFVATVRDLGLELPPRRPFNADLTAEGGHRVAGRMLSDDDIPRAIVCGSDAIASGAIGAPGTQGIRVPQDVAVTGIDGIYPDASMLAELTTVSLPRRQMATRAIEQLIRRIDGGGRAGPGPHPPASASDRHELRVDPTDLRPPALGALAALAART